MKRLRKLLWRILGFDYQTLLLKNDYTLLKNDPFSVIGKSTYVHMILCVRMHKVEILEVAHKIF